MNRLALVGWSKNPWDFEADLFISPEDFRLDYEQSKSYDLMIISIGEDLSETDAFLEYLFVNKISQNLLLVQTHKLEPVAVIPWLHRYPIISLIRSDELSRVEDLVNALLLTKRLTEQAEIHQSLLQQESEQQEFHYQKMLLELAEQQKKIDEIQSRLVFNLQQEKILHETLFIIMTSHGIADIELQLQEVLSPLLGKAHLRILLHFGAVHPLAWSPPAVGFDLYEEEKTIGQMIVTPLEQQTWTKRVLKLIENISEAVALHVPRFLAFEANIALELEWRSTFDAISDPLIVVSDTYSIVDANHAAKKRMPEGDLKMAPCFQLLFGRSSPCDFCHFGVKSNLESKSRMARELWEMSSHALSRRDFLWKDHNQKLFIHLYRNKFEQKEMEEKLKEFSRAAEVGIFKASLAHELNNPIGGLLTLAQLQKMDLTSDHPLFPLVQEIERQAFACRDLIQNLLQKTRS